MKTTTEKTDYLSSASGILTAAIAANLLWGSAPAFIKLGYRAFTIAGGDVMEQILFAGVRFTLAGVLTVLLGSLLRRRILLPKRSSGGMILVLATVQTVIQYAFYYIGLSHAPGYKASIIAPTSTFFALLIAALLFRQEKLTAKKLLGCLIGFAGVVVVSLSGQLGDPIVLSGWQFILGGLLMTVAGLIGGGRLNAVDAAAWVIMIYLGFLSAIAYMLWSLLLQRHPVSRIMVFSFLNPVFGVLLSAVLLDEYKALSIPRCLLAMLLVCIGVWIVNYPGKETISENKL